MERRPIPAGHPAAIDSLGNVAKKEHVLPALLQMQIMLITIAIMLITIANYVNYNCKLCQLQLQNMIITIAIMLITIAIMFITIANYATVFTNANYVNYNCKLC